MMKLFFLGLFTSGVILILLSLSAYAARKLRQHWRYRFHRWKHPTGGLSGWDRSIVKAKEQPRNIKIQLALKKAGFAEGRHYLLYKKGEWLLPVAAVIGVLLFHWVSVENRPIYDIRTLVWIVLLMGVTRLMWFLLLHWKAKHRAYLMGPEIVRLSDRLLMTLSAKTPLYYSIKSAGRTTKHLKPYIEELLMDWIHTHPQRAIQRFMERVALDEMIPLGNALLVILEHPAQAVYLMEQQMKNVEVMRDYVIKQRIRSKPVYLILLVTIPFTAGMVALIAPWYNETILQLHQIF